MPAEIVMPRMGLTMETGTVVRWLKQEGESVTQGEPLLEIETDKATVEIEALESGTLEKIVAGVGEEIPVGAVIGYLLKRGESAVQAAARRAAPAPVQARAAPMSLGPSDQLAQKVKASPAARRLARAKGVELKAVAGSGPGGRVVAWNVAEAAKTMDPPRVSPLAQRVAADIGVDLAQVNGTGPGGSITRRDVELATRSLKPVAPTAPVEVPAIKPLTRIHRVMADRMVHSFTTAPHFYLHTEVDARQLGLLRQQLLLRLEQMEQVHLTYTDLLLYLCARTLRRHPAVMAQWAPEGLRQFERVHIGLAIETESGLVVPVVRDADRLGLADIARHRLDLAERARSGKLRPDEFEEGVFTVTNLGMYRVDAFDAILNPPQAAILAVGRIKERALVENGQVIAAPMMTLSLSVDHRVLDGAQAARFLSDLAELLETPALAMR